MKCSKCGSENITKAAYCKYCGKAFTDRQQKEAYDKTIFGKLDKIENLWNNLTGLVNLSVITENRVFRIIVLVAIFLFGILFGNRYGNTMTILDGPHYTVQHNPEKAEFYVLTEKNSANLKLYLPQKTETLVVEGIDQNGVLCMSSLYNTNTEIVLNCSDEIYYTITSNGENFSQQIKLYVLCRQ